MTVLRAYKHIHSFFGEPLRYGTVVMYRPTRIYTVNHKIRGSLFLTITLANLNRFFYSFHIILIVKKFYM